MLYEILTLREIGSAVQALRILVDELTPLLKDIIEHQLSPQQVTVLDALMRLDGKAGPSQIAQQSRLPLNVVTVQLKRLTEADVLELQGGGKGRPAWYTVRDRLFYTWYEMRYLRPQRRRIEMFVQVLDLWFEAEERVKALETLSSTLMDCPPIRARSLAETAEYFAASLEHTPYVDAARATAIRNWVSVGDFKEAVSLFKEWGTEGATQQGNVQESYLALSQWLANRGDKTHAIEVLKASLAETPNDLKVLMEYGVALGLGGDHAQALSCFDRIVTSTPTDAPVELVAQALFNRGVAKQNVGRDSDALGDWIQILRLPHAPPEPCLRAGRTALSHAFARDDTKGLDLVVTAVDEWLAPLPAEARTACLMDFFAALARPGAESLWVYAFEHLAKDRTAETPAQLEVLNPVAEVLSTGDRAKLDPLPPEQRDFALGVLRRFERPEAGGK